MVQVRPLTPPDPALPAWCAVLAEHHQSESGGGLSAQVLAARVRHEPSGAGVRRWAAWAGGDLVEVAQSSPDRDTAFVRLYVALAHRRQGTGTALLAAVCSAHPDTVLKGITVAGQAGERFAASLGARVLMRLVVLEQALSGEAPDVALAPPYRMVFWRGGAPEDLVDSYAAAYSHLVDAPGADHQLPDPRYDRDRVRRWEQRITTGGHELWVCAALAGRTVVAFTEVEVGPQPAASQHATVVLPAHRPRGLGAAVKSAMTGRLRALRPDLATVTATVNEANTPMMALNQRLGYRPVRTRLLLELRTPAAGR